MHPRALLELAAELLRDVLAFDAPADAVVSTFFREHRALGPRERHALAETVYAVLRERCCSSTWRNRGSGALRAAPGDPRLGRATRHSCRPR